MSNEDDIYTDDKGELDTLGPHPIPNFLPPPHMLVFPEEAVKVTLSLSRDSVEFFKQKAEENRVPYQRMIRALIDEYVKRHR